MPTPQTLVEPTQHDLMVWFKMARNGDQCHVVTESGEPYTHLTRLSPTMVRWKVSGFTHKDTELSSTIHFMELLQTWNDFNVHV